MKSLVAAAAAFAGAASAAEVWPMPQVFNQGSTPSVIDPQFSFSCASAICPDPLQAAFDRYTSILFFAGPPATPMGNSITGLTVSVANSVPLGFGVSENYTMNVPVSGVATVTADNQWGALRALETFSQLSVWSGAYAVNGSQYVIDTAPIQITDFPRWGWRSLLIDSSRHYLTTAAIKITLDGMSYNKLNTLHWHILDDNSWPVYSANYPNFTKGGAYAPDAIYTHADVSDIVQYAWERGIRIIPEFDMPAHADIWGAGYPELTISCSGGQTLLNPTDEGGVYEVVDGLLSEFIPLFANTDFVHFGGDEVEDLTCWNESSEVQAFMVEKGLTSVDQVRNYFEDKVQTIANKYNASAMFWEEVFDKNYTLLPSSVVDIWLSYDEVEAAVKSGHRVVSSFGLYLDQQDPFGASHYFWADTWQNFYLNDPTFNRTFTPAEEALILGESLSQWGEQVDAGNIESRIWPRACGGSERMWSDKNLRDVNAAEGRLDHFRCKMLQRGIGAGPIRPASVYGYCPLPRLSRHNRLHELALPATM